MGALMEDMAGRMAAVAKQRTAKTDPGGHDVLARGAAMAHADAEHGHTDAAVSRRYSAGGRPVSRRAASEWKRVGPPELRQITAYLLVCSDPFRVEAHLRATVKMRALSKLSDRDLIERYHELLQHEPTVEAHDRIMDVSRGRSWLERAAASERDSAIDAEKAACEREFASRGITEREVLGG